jgi:hypothetical protein
MPYKLAQELAEIMQKMAKLSADEGERQRSLLSPERGEEKRILSRL